METRVEPQEVGRAGKGSPPQRPKASQKRNQLSESPCGPLFLLTCSRTREEGCTSAELDKGLSSRAPRRAPLPNQGSRQQGWQQQEEGVPAWLGVRTPRSARRGLASGPRPHPCTVAPGMQTHKQVFQVSAFIEGRGVYKGSPRCLWRKACHRPGGQQPSRQLEMGLQNLCRDTRTEVSAGPGRSDLTAGDACSGPLGGAG